MPLIAVRSLAIILILSAYKWCATVASDVASTPYS